MTRTLILPGFHNSDSDHWQSRWEARDGTLVRVIQDDWETPRCADWDRETRSSPRSDRARYAACGSQRRLRVSRTLGCGLSARMGSRSASSCAERSRGPELSTPADWFRADATAAAPISKPCSSQFQRPLRHAFSCAKICDGMGQRLHDDR